MMRGEVLRTVEVGGGGRRQRTQRAGEGLTADWEQHREERTLNMPFMFVTLDVSKLSGWLNVDASCQTSKGGHTTRCEVRAERRQAAGDRGASSVQGRAWLCRLGAGCGEERT